LRFKNEDHDSRYNNEQFVEAFIKPTGYTFAERAQDDKKKDKDIKINDNE
jgi:hypothetical protein